MSEQRRSVIEVEWGPGHDDDVTEFLGSLLDVIMTALLPLGVDPDVSMSLRADLDEARD